MAIDMTVVVVIAMLAIVLFGVWLVLSGSFRRDRPGTTSGGGWSRGGRIGSLMSPAFVLLGLAGTVGLFALLLGVLFAKF